jgi:hypothetical protein
MGPAAGARRRGQASTSLEANDPMVAMRAVEAGFAKLASAFGGPFIPAITSGLQDLANVLNWTAKLDKTYTDKDGKQVVWDDTNPLFPRGDARGPAHLSVYDAEDGQFKDATPTGVALNGPVDQKKLTAAALIPIPKELALPPGSAAAPMLSGQTTGGPVPVSIVNPPGSALRHKSRRRMLGHTIRYRASTRKRWAERFP